MNGAVERRNAGRNMESSERVRKSKIVFELSQDVQDRVSIAVQGV